MKRIRMYCCHPMASTILVTAIVSCVTASVLHAQVQPEPRPLFIEGYTDQVSYAPGDEVAFHISTTAAKYTLEISRLSHQNEIVLTEEDLPGAEYPAPINASSHGCGWPVAHRVRIPPDWKSGYYNVRLRVEDRGGRYVQVNRRTAEVNAFFVLRSSAPGRDTKILIQLATHTYNAYNKWGGHSFYGYHARNNLQGHRISYNRPLRGLFRNWELQFVAWAEKNGYTLDYACNGDLESRPEILKPYRLVLSVGHDEYWSAKMRDHLESFIGAGGNVAFFSGNSVCWQVRTEEDGRALVSYKQWYNQDPVYKTDDHRLLSTAWSHHLVARPENQLTGVGFLFGGYHLSHGQFMDGSGAFTVHRPQHWIFEGTNLERDDTFGGKHTIVGYECDGCEFRLEDGLPVPTHRDGTPKTFTILATAPARWHPDDSWWYERWDRDRIGAAVLGVYTRGGTVFTAGTTDWSHGLEGNDPTVVRITRNILDRLSR